MTQRTRLLIIYICFFLSGISGLTYEVVWSRYLSLFVGSTGEAHVIILATYMGGLALGAWLFGRTADKSPNPMLLYAKLEVWSSLLGLIYPATFEHIRAMFIAVARASELDPLGMRGGAILAAGLSILAPTVLMGGTLPVLGRALIKHKESVGQNIANLYYLNCFGAVVGSLIAGFYLIRVAGLEFSIILAAAVNLGCAAGAWILSRAGGAEGVGAVKGELSAEEAGEPAAATPEGMRRAKIALFVIAISGLVSMVYEVAWIRLMTLVLGSSSYSFALMLAAFIFGITLGSFILARKRTDGGYYRILGWCEIMIGVTALCSIYFYQHLPVVLNHWQTSLNPSEHTYPMYEAVKFLLCFLVMVVPTVFMGATLPAASRVVSDEVSNLGQKIGNVFALNTVGTVIGAIVGGFVLLPLLGIRHTVELAVAVNLALGLVVLLSDVKVPRPAPLFRPSNAIALCVAVPILYLIMAPSWDHRVMNAATYRIRKRIESLEELREKTAQRELLYYKDGTDASIAVARDGSPDGGHTVALLINGKPDASSGGDMQTQIMIGHIPMLIHPDPQEVLVVGLGSGVTAGTVTLYNPKHLECVELIPEVIEAAHFFKDFNSDFMGKVERGGDNVRLTIQDAKTHLLVTEKKYDVIVNQPTNPWIAGVSGLFSQEYFEACRQRLKPGGYFVQWFQVYEILDPTVYQILNTVQQTFPYSVMFNVASTDVALVCSTEPFAPDFRLMERRAAFPPVANNLEAWRIDGIMPILFMQMSVKSETRGPYIVPNPDRLNFAKPDLSIQPINSDFFPTLEFDAARGFFMGSEAKGIRALDERGMAPGRADLWIERYVAEKKPTEQMFEDYFEAINAFTSLNQNAMVMWASLWLKNYPDSPKAKLALARGLSAQKDRPGAEVRLLADPALGRVPSAIRAFVRLSLKQYEGERSFAVLPDQSAIRKGIAELVELNPREEAWSMYRLGLLDLDALKPADALANFKRAVEALDSPSRHIPADVSVAQVMLAVAEANLAAGDTSRAIAAVEAAKKASVEARAGAPEITVTDLGIMKARILRALWKQGDPPAEGGAVAQAEQ